MAEQQIDLGEGWETQPTYSEQTMEKAVDALDRGLVTLTPSSRAAFVKSSRTRATYNPAVAVSAQGKPLGVTCTCDNGKKGGLRARCYHAAALELSLGFIDQEGFSTSD